MSTDARVCLNGREGYKFVTFSHLGLWVKFARDLAAVLLQEIITVRMWGGNVFFYVCEFEHSPASPSPLLHPARSGCAWWGGPDPGGERKPLNEHVKRTKYPINFHHTHTYLLAGSWWDYWSWSRWAFISSEHVHAEKKTTTHGVMGFRTWWDKKTWLQIKTAV